VRNVATIRNSFGQLRRRLRLWRARLRRERTVVALFVVLTLGLSEPLMCILHCELWLPLAFHSYFASQHQHQHHAHMVMPAAEQAQSGTSNASVSASEDSGTPGCFWHFQPSNGSDVPFYVPPSPVHDFIPTLVLLLIVLLLISVAPAAPPGDPPRSRLAPPLQPPIPIAL
jgi:hypothetical protein